MDANLLAESERVRYSLIRLMWGCATGQGIGFFLSSVLNSIYNFAQVCHKDRVQRKSVLQLVVSM